MKVLIVTGHHGEMWRCQAITRHERRCVKDAVLEGQHPIRKSKMALCTTHAIIAQRKDTEIRLDNSAGYMRVFLPVSGGGALDGVVDGCPVPYNLRVGDQWIVDVRGGALEKYQLAVKQAVGEQPQPYMQYVGPAVTPEAPGGPETGEPQSP